MDIVAVAKYKERNWIAANGGLEQCQKNQLYKGQNKKKTEEQQKSTTI